MKECDARIFRWHDWVFFAGLLLLACAAAPTETYEMGQPIQMGPYIFELERTEQHTFYEGLEIHVIVRILENNAAPFTTTFDDFLGYWAVRDQAGNTYDAGTISPLSGDRRSSEQWVARFRIFTSPGTMGVRDPEHVGERVSDFRLFIENPFPQGEQPRRVALQLR